MKRRNFIQAAATISGASLLPEIKINNSPNVDKDDMGYQLFSIRDRMKTDPVGTLKALKKVGYKHFEIYGYDDQQNTIYGYSPKEFNKILVDLDIKATSGHYGFSDYLLKSEDEMKRFVDRCLRCAKALESKYITWPWLAPEFRNITDYKVMVDRLNVIGEHLHKTDVGFAYHNHGFEFMELENNESTYDLILKRTDPDKVKLQMDMYWVMHSSMTTTPKRLVAENPGRFTMWHIKDMDPITRDYSELGSGSINYLNVLPDPEQSGLEYYYIEQGGNFALNSLESARTSAEYYKRNLSKS